MNHARLFLQLLACAALLPTAHGATVSAESGDTHVSTLDSGETISITMHRVTANVLGNAAPGAGIDAPLQVMATNRALLGAQPQLQGNSGLQVTGGLVADGVTPLLFHITTSAPAAGGKT